MLKTNIKTITHYDLQHKGFLAMINIDRGSMCWGYVLLDASGKIASKEKDIHFMSEQDIEQRMEIMINDCILSPEDYY